MRALAFPMRLQENGLLQRQDRTQSILDLLQVYGQNAGRIMAWLGDVWLARFV